MSIHDTIAHANSLMQACDVTIISSASLKKALILIERYQYSIFDSIIIATALDVHCSKLYSEDMQHGQVVEGLTIVNPFESPKILLAR